MPTATPRRKAKSRFGSAPTVRLGLMQGYQSEDGTLSGADGAFYRSGDVVFVDEDGLFHVRRALR